MIFRKLGGGGAKAVWNFPKNSSVLDVSGIPKWFITFITTTISNQHCPQYPNQLAISLAGMTISPSPSASTSPPSPHASLCTSQLPLQDRTSARPMLDCRRSLSGRLSQPGHYQHDDHIVGDKVPLKAMNLSSIINPWNEKYTATVENTATPKQTVRQRQMILSPHPIPSTSWPIASLKIS